MALAAHGAAVAAGGPENHFASIHLDRDKIGQVHYTVTLDPEGAVEELRTRASVSLLGIKLLSFDQQLHEVWQDGGLRTLRGHTNDNGTAYDATVERAADGYSAALNGKPLTLPAEAFPASLWHYRITEQSLLFDLSDLRLMRVEVARRQESLSHHGQSVPAERFDFTGDWQGSVWFDDD
jgi:hypothetical protein